MKWLCGILTLTFIVLCGCRAYVSVDKRPNTALPIYDTSTTNKVIKDWVILDQGYEVKYSKWGFNTEIQSMSAELTTNKTVKFTLGGLTSTVATNNFSIKVDDLIQMISLFRDTTNDVIVLDRNKLLDRTNR